MKKLISYIQTEKLKMNQFSQFLILLGFYLMIAVYIFTAVVKAYSIINEVYLYPLHIFKTGLELAPAMFAVCFSCAVICDLFIKDKEKDQS